MQRVAFEYIKKRAGEVNNSCEMFLFPLFGIVVLSVGGLSQSVSGFFLDDEGLRTVLVPRLAG